MSIGYPLGAVFGGIVAARLLQGHDWRAILFWIRGHGGADSDGVSLRARIGSLADAEQPAGALEHVNRTMTKMGHPAVTVLPSLTADTPGKPVAGIFASGLIASTVIVTLAYFFHITTFYFIVKWIPKIVVDLGFAPSSAAGVLVWTNVGGAVGGAIFGLLTQRYSVKALTIGMLLASTVMVTLFGRTPADLQRLSLICAIAGFCTTPASSVSTRSSRRFPNARARVRHRVRDRRRTRRPVLAPIIAGFLFAVGSRCRSSRRLAFGSLIAAFVLILLSVDHAQ
jgi:hypothetical protein